MQSEIDLLAVIEDSLFVFECKNSLLPSNYFELKNSFYDLKKAANQLSRFFDLYSNNQDFQIYLKQRLKLQSKYCLPSKIVTCIVTGNRMFKGLNINGHSTRPIQEICSFLKTSNLTYGGLSLNPLKFTKDSQIKLWEKDVFTAKDLTDYISSSSLLYQSYFKSATRSDKTVQLGTFTLSHETYIIDEETAFEHLLQKSS